MEVDRNVGRRLVRREDALGKVDADGVRERFDVGEILQAEGGDKGVAIFGRIQRQAAKENRTVLGGFFEQLVAVGSDPIGGTGQSHARRGALKRQGKCIVAIGLLAGY